jgi:hypothetical protein
MYLLEFGIGLKTDARRNELLWKTDQGAGALSVSNSTGTSCLS